MRVNPGLFCGQCRYQQFTRKTKRAYCPKHAAKLAAYIIAKVGHPADSLEVLLVKTNE